MSIEHVPPATATATALLWQSMVMAWPPASSSALAPTGQGGSVDVLPWLKARGFQPVPTTYAAGEQC